MICQYNYLTSIHAPLRGATGARDVTRTITSTLIHAPSVGRDPIQTIGTRWHICFNQRTSRWCDRSDFYCPCVGMDFNPRTPQGVRLQRKKLAVSGVTSIHAPLAGRDQDTSSRCRICPNFNPRTPAVCDSQNAGKQHVYRTSIHAPLRGATILTVSTAQI